MRWLSCTIDTGETIMTDSMKRFTDQVAVVTGAGRGIGKAVAIRLANEGARIAIISRTEANSQLVAAELNALRPESAIPYTVDVSNGEAVADLCSRIVKELGKVSVLVNNAGVTRDRLSMRMSEEDWERIRGHRNAWMALDVISIVIRWRAFGDIRNRRI